MGPWTTGAVAATGSAGAWGAGCGAVRDDGGRVFGLRECAVRRDGAYDDRVPARLRVGLRRDAELRRRTGLVACLDQGPLRLGRGEGLRCHGSPSRVRHRLGRFRRAVPDRRRGHLDRAHRRRGHEGRFLHRDFQPGNVLFDATPSSTAGPRIRGVVDWVRTSWGPADLDVARCSSNLALLHGPAWGLRFAEAYEEAGGVLAATAGERLYWRLLDALAFAAGAESVARPWRRAGRAELTTRAVEERLDAYVAALLDTLG
ncbi:aminoglycoside phosphotransferase family protein [Streptomyces sp. NBC_00343]